MVLAGAAPATKPAADRSFTSKEHGFTLAYPPTLEPMKSPSRGSIVYLGTPGDGENDIFRESVQVKVEAENLGNISLAQAVRGFEGSMKKHGVTILESAEAKLGGRPAQRIVYAHRVKLPNGEADAKAVIYLALRGGTAYGVDVRATAETFEKFAPVGQQVVDSFEWSE